MSRFRWKHLYSAKARAVRRADQSRDSGAAAKAATQYGLVLERWGPDFALLMQMGNAQKDSRNYPEAERTYQSALAVRPNDADAHLQHGHLLKLVGDLPGAAASYARASALDPDLADARDELQQMSHRGDAFGLRLAGYEEQEALTLRSDIPLMASIVYFRIANQYRWRRG